MTSRHGLKGAMRHPSRTPYTTKAGVQIGVLWQPKPPQPFGDCLRLQTALLDERTQGERNFLQRLLGSVWRYC